MGAALNMNAFMLGAFNMNEATGLTVHGKLVQWMSEGQRRVELKADSNSAAKEWAYQLQKTSEMAKETEALIQQLEDALQVMESNTQEEAVRRAAHNLEDVVERCKEASMQVHTEASWLGDCPVCRVLLSVCSPNVSPTVRATVHLFVRRLAIACALNMH